MSPFVTQDNTDKLSAIQQISAVMSYSPHAKHAGMHSVVACYIRQTNLVSKLPAYMQPDDAYPGLIATDLVALLVL